MRITVIGLWHLGVTTAACLAKLGHQVTGLELRDSMNLDNLRNNIAPLDEPGISALMEERRVAGKLRWSYSSEATIALDTDVLWICHDVDVNAEGVPNADACLSDIAHCLRYLSAGKLVVLSSQLPVGTCAKLQAQFPLHRFAVIPENLRIGRAISSFMFPGRVIVGLDSKDAKTREEIGAILALLPGDVITMSPASAEMTKHALNGFLALSVAYANEVSRICDVNGACASDVMRGVMADERAGKKAYLRPGPPFSGWTLIRDVNTLEAQGAHSDLRIIPAIQRSNDIHALHTKIAVNYGKL